MSVYYCGYAWLQRSYHLDVDSPIPIAKIGGVKHPDYRLFRQAYRPEDTLAGHLTFALKHEPLNLAILKSLFDACDPEILAQWVANNPQGVQSRRAWFFYEWLTGDQLRLPDAAGKVRYINALDEKSYYTAAAINSPHHKVRNNMTGVPGFCYLVRKTETMLAFDDEALHQRMQETYASHPMIGRAEAFLLTKDSQSSFQIRSTSIAICLKRILPCW